MRLATSILLIATAGISQAFLAPWVPPPSAMPALSSSSDLIMMVGGPRPPSFPPLGRGMPKGVVLSPRQRKDKEEKEEETVAQHEAISGQVGQFVRERMTAEDLSRYGRRLDLLQRRANSSVTMTELYPSLASMAKLINHRVWLTEDLNGVEVVPAMREEEEKDMEKMRQAMASGNFSEAVEIYSYRYRRYETNAPPADQTALCFEALYRDAKVNQTIQLYNFWYRQRFPALNAKSLYWVIKALLSVQRFDAALDVFRACPRFGFLPSPELYSLMVKAAVDEELYELGTEILLAQTAGGYTVDRSVVNTLITSLLDINLLDHADKCINILLEQHQPIAPHVGTYYKNFLAKNGRLRFAYLHLTDPRLLHPTFRASKHGYNMLLWRMLRAFSAQREHVLTNKITQESLRTVTHRVARVLSTMKRFGLKVTPQNAAQLQDLWAATTEFGQFRRLEQWVKEGGGAESFE